MCPDLVHAQGGSQSAASHYGDTGQLQQTLNRSVLTVFSVEHGKGPV